MLQRVFVDADVLASHTPHEWLALLREETGDWFQLHSSAEAVAAAVGRWVREDPAARGGAAQRRLELLSAGIDEVVGTVGDLSAAIAPERDRAGDPVADARAAGAHVLLSSSVTAIRDADELPFELYAPDEFLCLLDDTAATHVRNVVRRQRDRTRLPDSRADDAALTDALTAAGCPAFAARVASHLRTIGR